MVYMLAVLKAMVVESSSNLVKHMNPLLGSIIIVNRGVQSTFVDNEVILYVESSQLYLGLEGISIKIWDTLIELQPIRYDDYLAFIIDAFNYETSEVAKLEEFIYVLYEKGAIRQAME